MSSGSVTVLAALLASVTASCGTIYSRSEASDLDSTLYGGVRMDALFVVSGPAGAVSGTEEGAAWGLFFFCVGLVDFPLSLVADTVLLPWTIPETFGGQRQDFTALVAAIEAGDLARAKSLAQEAPRTLRCKAEHGSTPLHLAVAKGQPDLVEWLASQFARDNVDDSSGETPLIQALRADRADLVRILVEEGADPNHRMSHSIPDWTPLHCAASRKDPALAQALLDRGATVNARTERGDTPLHVAAEGDNASVAELLLGRGAEVDAKGHRGETPLHVAASMGNLAVARALVSHGADVNARTEDWDNRFVHEQGTTPIEEALRSNHAEMVEFLRSQGSVP